MRGQGSIRQRGAAGRTRASGEAIAGRRRLRSPRLRALLRCAANPLTALPEERGGRRPGRLELGRALGPAVTSPIPRDRVSPVASRSFFTFP